ncbi:hypothetical protein A3D78_05295 [Candidatus Gottesmanbacteria bacterium RIFCSPHIGHO2_02_FULL_39_14]|uniref:PIN domain-containing protein n=3 Tax=Candidatus Gottesmaniibacteriota TaxID=1752720 RepID=A0A1F5ZYV5_9BACT|nr:MAG: hypothetical protein A2153_03025 [Candidatus Gottesmanbacteria bacterium RBG_16_38_7b]OGG17640.1 MAG: hypothetical protein A3D78_05295 [Candidatus Gottesmanbacteria bacterium RIFCSPHIGHO2_02_FULL_39_14]OGG32030.1 MAG: hypothetical protein A3I51_01815 [Candidatus Gottesmanbacteria bacterium RIFCSPLOWO2_02_FULL_38_8]
MKTLIIADSSGIISLISETDKNHSLAVKISLKLEKAKGSIIVPTEVFAEILNITGKKLGHKIALIVAEKILSMKTFLISDTNEKIRKRAMDIFKDQPESVSFTDCIVMANADSFKTKDIFGFDEVFRKNGYKRIGVDK